MFLGIKSRSRSRPRSVRCRSSAPPSLDSFVSFLLPGCFNERNSEMKKLLLTSALATLALPLWAKTDAISLIPTDAVTVGVVRLAEMRSSPLSSTLFQQTDKVSTNGDAAVFLREAGLQPTRDIDVIVAATTLRTPLGHDGDLLIAADGRFNVERLTQALLTRGGTKKPSANGSYVILPHARGGRAGAVA